MHDDLPVVSECHALTGERGPRLGGTLSIQCRACARLWGTACHGIKGIEAATSGTSVRGVTLWQSTHRQCWRTTAVGLLSTCPNYGHSLTIG